MKVDVKAVGAEIIGAVKSYVDRTFAGIDERLKELEEHIRRPASAAVSGALIDRSGQLILTLTDGTTRELGAVVGADGERGADGAAGRDGVDGSDGLGFEDLSVEYDGERSFSLRFKQGEREKTFDFTVPVMIYRGVWQEGQSYQRGDTVTWGGALWHCNGAGSADEAPGKPVEGSKAWTLAVKRGRDGKPGERGLPGAEGRNGRDLTQLGADGSKW